MNTNEFYKELFEKYAFDEEKIRKNAIKAAKTPAWQRTLGAHWKSVAGVAAAVAVTVGGVAAYNAVNPSINVIPEDTLPSASKRLEDAEKNYFNPPAETETHSSIYVSFMDVMSYSDISVALSAVPDYDDIDIVCIYLSDGSKITDVRAVENFAQSNSSVKNICGAKLSAPTGAYQDIQDLSSVFLAEFESDEINDETFSPIPYDDSDPLTNDFDLIITTAPQPSVTTSSFSFAGETSSAVSEAAPVTDNTSIPTADTTGPAPVSEDSEDTEDIDEYEEDPESTEEGEGIEDLTITEDSEADTTVTTDAPEQPPVSELPEQTAEITVPVTEITDAPQIGLMTQLYYLNVENALETILIDNYAIVLTRGEVYFCSVGGMTGYQPKVCETASPKFAYYGNGKVIFTGIGENGLRNKLIILDMENDCVYSNDISATLGQAEIASINYSAGEGKYFLKAVTSSETFFYEVTITTETGAVFRPLCEFSGAVSAAGYKNGTLWFTGTSDGVGSSLYSFDCTNGVMTEIQSFGSPCKIRRSVTFESFIITTSDKETNAPISYVFNASTNKLINAPIDGESLIAEEDGEVYISYYGSTMKLNENGELTPTAKVVRFTDHYSSPFKVVSTDSEKVVIALDDGSVW